MMQRGADGAVQPQFQDCRVTMEPSALYSKVPKPLFVLNQIVALTHLGIFVSGTRSHVAYKPVMLLTQALQG